MEEQQHHDHHGGLRGSNLLGLTICATMGNHIHQSEQPKACKMPMQCVLTFFKKEHVVDHYHI